MTNVYEYTSYKDYLKELINESSERGFSSRLAESANCQKSYFSHALNGKAHLLPDHIYGISSYLKLSQDEGSYLQLILDYERATSLNYQKHLLNRIHDRQSEWKDLKNRLTKKSLPSEDTAAAPHQYYYSNYLYGAIHIAVSIPNLQDLKSLSGYFMLPERTIESVLIQLLQMGLVENKGKKWFWKSGDLHLPKDSPWINTHHNNWRMQALVDLNYKKSDSLHFSGVQSLSKKDYESLLIEMTKWIQFFREKTGPSAPEELICFNLDLFSLQRK